MESGDGAILLHIPMHDGSLFGSRVSFLDLVHQLMNLIRLESVHEFVREGCGLASERLVYMNLR